MPCNRPNWYLHHPSGDKRRPRQTRCVSLVNFKRSCRTDNPPNMDGMIGHDRSSVLRGESPATSVNLVQGKGIIGGLSLLSLQQVHRSRTPTTLHRLLCTLVRSPGSSRSRMSIILFLSAHDVIGWTRTVKAHHLRKKSRPIRKEMGIYAHAPAKGWCADHHLQAKLIRCRYGDARTPNVRRDRSHLTPVAPPHWKLQRADAADDRSTRIWIPTGWMSQ